MQYTEPFHEYGLFFILFFYHETSVLVSKS